MSAMILAEVSVSGVAVTVGISALIALIVLTALKSAGGKPNADGRDWCALINGEASLWMTVDELKAVARDDTLVRARDGTDWLSFESVFGRGAGAPAAPVEITREPRAESAQAEDGGTPAAVALGWCLLTLGAALLLWGFGMDTTNESVHNIGLINTRLCLVITGGFVFQTGVLAVLLGGWRR